MFGLTAIMAMALGAAPLNASDSVAHRCTVVNLMPSFREYWATHGNAAPVAARRSFVNDFVNRYPDLYSTNVLHNGSPIDAQVDSFLRSVPDDMPSIHSMSRLIEQNFVQYVVAFEKQFPDFRCDDPVYFYPALYAFDGAVRKVDGRVALLFGVDAMADLYDAGTAAVFFDHELFHRYNAQVTGLESAAPGNALYLPLWSEGLAVYVSHAMNPNTSEAVALGRPIDLAERATPLTAALAASFLRAFDSTDYQTYSKFFEGGTSGGTSPPRSGYFLGNLVVSEIAAREHLDLLQLARLRGPELRRLVHDELLRLTKT